MEKIVVITVEELRALIKECLQEEHSTNIAAENPAPIKEYIKSLQDIADLFNCSIPTAQRIKNSIPKPLYFQCGRTFSISKDYLLQEFPKLNKSRRDR